MPTPTPTPTTVSETAQAQKNANADDGKVLVFSSCEEQRRQGIKVTDYSKYVTKNRHTGYYVFLSPVWCEYHRSLAQAIAQKKRSKPQSFTTPDKLESITADECVEALADMNDPTTESHLCTALWRLQRTDVNGEKLQVLIEEATGLPRIDVHQDLGKLVPTVLKGMKRR